MPEEIEQISHSRPTPFNPEGILMIGTAMFADLISLLCLALDIFFGIGEIIAWIPDIFFTIILGGWMYMRGSGGLNTGRKISNFLKKRGSMMALKYVPFLGTAMPIWTITVIMFLIQKPDA